MILTAIFPIRTVSEANMRDHWATKAARHKSQRQQAFMECRLAFKYSPILEIHPQKVTLFLTRIASRKLDKDNLYGAFKHVTDGICEWLGIDDGSDNFTLICAQEVVKGANAVKVRISVG